MTPAEYVQLKAFARVDGVWLAVLWSVSFACYIVGLGNQVYALAALLLMLITPFFVGRRLRRFRDEDRNGVISLMRGWAFVILVFFYAAILLAVVQYVYFAFIDHGYLLTTFSSVLESPEGQRMVEQLGMQRELSESMMQMLQMRPIDYALNMLTMNICLGIVLGLPIAALLQRSVQRPQS